MSLITAKGNEAVASAAKSSVDLEKVMIRLKDGDSIKVRLLGTEDFVEYKAISGFNLGVYTQPCLEPLGQKDYFAEAAKLANEGKVDEKFKVLYPRSRYLIAMADVNSETVRIWDASKQQFNKFVSDLEEYKEIIEDGDELVFTFKRTGNKTETSYSLSPVMKPKAAEKEGFHKFDGQEVTVDYFESVLQPRTAKLQVSVLKEAGFPVEEYFPEVDLTEESEDNSGKSDTEVNPLDQI
ncbi:hypothetical protein [uncultured Vagococcus sp.]|uniref:hypothetical protein n=1 Tax=uncultured Vagococcus sp. TaxID=189676 RepID=UPI00258C5E67|nr:hypothetical protein [uncultured Vagococcus sp.]